jgi:hypothetical protein
VGGIMTDKEKVISLFRELNIGFSDEEGFVKTYSGDTNNVGYNFFYTEFRFDKDGTFVSMGAYE